MVVGVDESRRDQFAGGIYDFDAGFCWQIRSDALDPFAADQDVGLRRLVDVAIVIVDAAAADQNACGLSGAGHVYFSWASFSPPAA